MFIASASQCHSHPHCLEPPSLKEQQPPHSPQKSTKSRTDWRNQSKVFSPPSSSPLPFYHFNVKTVLSVNTDFKRTICKEVIGKYASPSTMNGEYWSPWGLETMVLIWKNVPRVIQGGCRFCKYKPNSLTVSFPSEISIDMRLVGLMLLSIFLHCAPFVPYIHRLRKVLGRAPELWLFNGKDSLL